MEIMQIGAFTALLVGHGSSFEQAKKALGITSLLHEIMPGRPPAARMTDNMPATYEIPILFKVRGGRRYIMTPDGRDLIAPKAQRFESNMIKAIVHGHEFLHMLDRDPDLAIMKLAERRKMDHGYIAKAIRMDATGAGYHRCDY